MDNIEQATANPGEKRRLPPNYHIISVTFDVMGDSVEDIRKSADDHLRALNPDAVWRMEIDVRRRVGHPVVPQQWEATIEATEVTRVV
jgi:hypothetical protein